VRPNEAGWLSINNVVLDGLQQISALVFTFDRSMSGKRRCWCTVAVVYFKLQSESCSIIKLCILLNARRLISFSFTVIVTSNFTKDDDFLFIYFTYNDIRSLISVNFTWEMRLDRQTGGVFKFNVLYASF